MFAELPAARAAAAGGVGADDLLRRAGRREPRLPLVQLLSGRDLHGRRRLARARRRARHRRAVDQAGSCCSPIVGGVFVMEALSVIIQVGSFKLTGKRVFKMAPLHHHFELIGWSEPKVITRFLITRDHLRPLQPDDVEAAMTRRPAFSVRGKRVVVVGAARSGVAAAELLVRRGATRHAHRRARVDRRRAIACARPASRSSSAGIAPRRSQRADLIVLSPGVPPQLAGHRSRAPPRRAGDRASSSWRRAGCAAASSPSPAPRASRRRRR